MSKDISSGVNLFVYCNNDPVNNLDPSGEITIANVICALIGLLIGIVGGYFISKWVADKLGLTGVKRKIFIVGLTSVITVSSTAIGYFIGPYALKLSKRIASYTVDLITR